MRYRTQYITPCLLLLTLTSCSPRRSAAPPPPQATAPPDPWVITPTSLGATSSPTYLGNGLQGQVRDAGGLGMTGSFVASFPSPIYRITAIARGIRTTDEASEVILQSFFSLGN